VEKEGSSEIPAITETRRWYGSVGITKQSLFFFSQTPVAASDFETFRTPVIEPRKLFSPCYSRRE
jgi:hypothetical protein